MMKDMIKRKMGGNFHERYPYKEISRNISNQCKFFQELKSKLLPKNNILRVRKFLEHG